MYPSRRGGWRTALAGAAAAAVAVAALPDVALAGPAGPGRIDKWRDVVVTGASAEAAARAVAAAGGQVLVSLPVANGVAARLPGEAELGPQWVVAPQRTAKV